MLYIDDREKLSKNKGAEDFAKLFPRGFQREVKRLEYGDFHFMGKGEEGVPVPIGIERKTLNDLLNSINSGRLSGHQIPGLMTSYKVVYLVVEGLWRPNPETGILEVYSGRWKAVRHGSRQYTAREVNNYLNTLEIMLGVHIRRTVAHMETVHLLCSLYGWWNADFDKHKSHLAFDVATAPGVFLRKPTFIRRVAKEFPGVGWERTKAIELRFRNVEEMVLASVKDWEEIDGIGKTIANNVYNKLREDRSK